MADVTGEWMESMIPLRALVYYDRQYAIWIGQSLETGHLVTAEDSDLAGSMISELLQDEATALFKKGTLGEFLAHPAPIEIWKRWMLASRVLPVEQKELVAPAYKNEPAQVILRLITEASQ